MDKQSAQLSHAEIRRYSRHLIMPEVGMAGQKKLKAASVLTVGAGGLGSPLAMYLAAAGVGRIGVVDFDVVDESNLQRQIIHGQSALGQPKRESAKARLLDINPHIQVETYCDPLTSFEVCPTAHHCPELGFLLFARLPIRHYFAFAGLEENLSVGV